MGESPDCLLLSGTVVGENPDHVCWVVSMANSVQNPGRGALAYFLYAGVPCNIVSPCPGIYQHIKISISLLFGRYNEVKSY